MLVYVVGVGGWRKENQARECTRVSLARGGGWNGIEPSHKRDCSDKCLSGNRGGTDGQRLLGLY